ncbi:hypothetical protein OG785_17655 [Streptomyces sp. NBC_00006]|uniref:hypothetical protein n=1 Tax=Streptomyces sp. NBC_00006 TaxID=2975619 RepID=UPI002251E257|nr:hypothetical protein [Streptomyces sp. NBC_00006]MCX5532380.1 hypothetical protein [Streptomyces sp. NBC_00006]
MTDRIPYLGRVCPNCDGFPVVAVSSGLGRDARGNLRTLTVTCRTCVGHGTLADARRARLQKAAV